jgi:hypothetical protein
MLENILNAKNSILLKLDHLLSSLGIKRRILCCNMAIPPFCALGKVGYFEQQPIFFSQTDYCAENASSFWLLPPKMRMVPVVIPINFFDSYHLPFLIFYFSGSIELL